MEKGKILKLHSSGGITGIHDYLMEDGSIKTLSATDATQNYQWANTPNTPNITRQPGEPLTKENFFNPLMELYPEAMKEFCEWIDEYKRRINWNVLFRNPAFGNLLHNWDDIKFHDLPLAMQVGILIEYIESKDGTYCLSEITNAGMEGLVKGIISFFEPADLPAMCRVCGRTDEDCHLCIEAQGFPCYWVEDDLCSRCYQQTNHNSNN